MNKKTKKSSEKKVDLKKVLKKLYEDISYSNGGWLNFLSRMMINVIILYYVVHFLKAFLMFVFLSAGVVDESHLRMVRLLVWATGILFLIKRRFD